MNTEAVDERSPGFEVERHYLRDLSIENPRGPVQGEALGKLGVTLDGRVHSRPSGENRAEVTIHYRFEVSDDNQVALLGEIEYVAEVLLHLIPQPVALQVLMVAVPGAVFPAVAEIIGACAHFAGYPALPLQPLDFEEMFRQAVADGRIDPMRGVAMA